MFFYHGTTELPRAIEISAIITGVALARFLAITLCAALCSLFVDERWLAFYYYPAAAIDVVALLALGYWAAIGIGIGSLIWNIWQLEMTPFQNTALFALGLIRCALALWILQRLYPPADHATWSTPTLRSVLVFAVIYAVVTTLFAHAVLTSATPDQTLTTRELASLFGGTIMGSFGGFVTLNLAFTAYLSSRLKDD